MEKRDTKELIYIYAQPVLRDSSLGKAGGVGSIEPLQELVVSMFLKATGLDFSCLFHVSVFLFIFPFVYSDPYDGIQQRFGR